MSRCFPFPPPGYCGNRASNEALIESIKLQRERELAKAEKKKQKKREKKEKKRNKKEVAKQNPNVGHDEKKEKKRNKMEEAERNKKEEAELNPNVGHDEKKEKKRNKKEEAELNPNVGHDEKPRKGLNSWADSKPGYEKRREDSVEQLERSDLTEEHGQPVSLRKPSYSSDNSTQNSNKRKRHASPPPICTSGHDSTQNSNKRKMHASPTPIGTSGHGKIIRIRLPLQKHKEPDSGKEPLCTTSGRSDSYVPLRANSFVHGVHLRDEKSKIASGTSEIVSETTEIFTRGDTHLAACSTPFDNETQRTNSPYEDLFRSWLPPALESQLSDSGDQEWLFGQKRQDCGRQGEKRYKASGDISCCGRSTLWPPRAQYLPEADIYALPFTVPF